jgi:hypothetical protein
VDAVCREGAVIDVLVVRAWLEPGGEPRLRVTMVEVSPAMADRRLLATTSPDAVCEAVRKWLTEIERRSGAQAP